MCIFLLGMRSMTVISITLEQLTRHLSTKHVSFHNDPFTWCTKGVMDVHFSAWYAVDACIKKWQNVSSIKNLPLALPGQLVGIVSTAGP